MARVELHDRDVEPVVGPGVVGDRHEDLDFGHMEGDSRVREPPSRGQDPQQRLSRAKNGVDVLGARMAEVLQAPFHETGQFPAHLIGGTLGPLDEDTFESHSRFPPFWYAST